MSRRTPSSPAKIQSLQILTRHHRRGIFLYTIQNTAQLHRTALKIARDNAMDIYYQDNTDLSKQMREAVTKKDGRACWRLFQRFAREYGNYHEVELSVPESV